MNYKILCCLLTSVILASCSGGLQTFSDRDIHVDLKKYKTYAWIAPGDTVLNRRRRDKIYGDLIVSSSNAELKKKGMTIDISQPDALFMYESGIDEKIQYTQAPTVSVGV